MIGRLDDIAYAVTISWNISSPTFNLCLAMLSLAKFCMILSNGVHVAFVRRGGDPLIELVAPTHNESPVSRILERGRGGLYHVCYEVRDIEAEISRLRELRYVPLGRPVAAVAFRRIVFLISPHRDLFELVEGPAELFTP
jgi:methylmalonyl-CoA/ethylmalonyl-CoA epimerase